MHPAIALAWVAAGLALAMALFVLLASPRHPANRRLAVIFVLHATVISCWVLIPLFPTVRAGWSFAVLNNVILLALPAVYLWFLSTLDTPWARWLRRPVAKAGIVAMLLAFVAPLYVVREVFLPPVVAPWFGGGWGPATSPELILLLQGCLIPYLAALAITIQAYRGAPVGSPSRRRAFWFMVAFGFHDVYYLYRTVVLVGFLGTPSVIPDGWVAPTIQYGRPIAIIVWVLLLSYGMLRHQLFDLEVLVRRNAVRLAIVATLVGTILLAGEAMRQAVGPRGSTVIAVGLAVLIGVGLLPLQRVAERALDRVFPGPTAAELDARKVDVFRSALQDAAAADGALAVRDAARVDALQRQLGISDRERALLARTLVAPGRAEAGLSPGRRVLDRYVLETPLDPAGGRTWLARRGQRPVVVKRYPLLSGGLQERQVLESVRHPNLVRLLDAGDEAGGTFVVLEHLAAGSLADRLVRVGPLPMEVWQDVADGLLAGLHALHERGVLHGDIKPSNVLLDEAGRAKLADFDVAHLGGLERTRGPPAVPAVGTLRYMAPEQARGRPATKASDIFAVAATLHEALTGTPYLPVVPGESEPELRQRVAQPRRYVPPRGIPADLDPWFAKALDPAAERRFRSVREMRAALRRLTRRTAGRPATASTATPA